VGKQPKKRPQHGGEIEALGGATMFKEGTPIDYSAPADLKKWPSLNSQRSIGTQPYLVFPGTLAECIRELMAKHVKAISLYDIVTAPNWHSIRRCYLRAMQQKLQCGKIFQKRPRKCRRIRGRK
jgi:hypothetical protein